MVDGQGPIGAPVGGDHALDLPLKPVRGLQLESLERAAPGGRSGRLWPSPRRPATLALLGSPSTSLLLGRRAKALEGGSVFADGTAAEGAIKAWSDGAGLTGGDGPLRTGARRLRRTVQVLHGSPRNNTVRTHEDVYMLRDEQVREQSAEVVAAGLAEAVGHAQDRVRMRMVSQATGSTADDAEQVAHQAGLAHDTAAQVALGALDTAVAACTDFEHSPFTPRDRARCRSCPSLAIGRLGPQRLRPLAGRQLGRLPGIPAGGFMRAGWAVINLPTPEILLHRSGSSTRPRLSPGSLKRTFLAWGSFARWLAQHQVTCLDQVGRNQLEKYPQFLSERGLTHGPVTTEMFAITRLWAYAPFLLSADRITMPPWDEPGATPGDFLGTPAGGAGENSTIPVHPAVMSPLLVWELRTVTDFAPDILAAWREARRLADRIPSAPKPGGRADIRAYLQRLHDTGQQLPVFTGRQTAALAHAHQATQPGKTTGVRPLVHNRFVAGTLGVTATQVTTLLTREPHLLEGLRFSTGAALATPITAHLGGRPCRNAVDVEDVMDLALQLAAAARLTTAYLSGMRPKEILNLERGCCTAERRQDGTVRYLITGRHFKGVTDEDGNTIPGGQARSQPWTVIEPVHRAITVLEELTDGPLLFPRDFSKAAKPRAYLGDAMSAITANARIARFAVWANTLAADPRPARGANTLSGAPA